MWLLVGLCDQCFLPARIQTNFFQGSALSIFHLYHHLCYPSLRLCSPSSENTMNTSKLFSRLMSQQIQNWEKGGRSLLIVNNPHLDLWHDSNRTAAVLGFETRLPSVVAIEFGILIEISNLNTSFKSTPNLNLKNSIHGSGWWII